VNKKDAYRAGVDYGYEAGTQGDFSKEELSSKDAFMGASWEIAQGMRQYAGHPGYDFNLEPNAESLWDAFEQGEMAGARQAWRERQRR